MRKTNPGRQGRRWRRLASEVQGETCYFCGGGFVPTDWLAYGKWYTCPWNHPMARTVHHIVELSTASTPEELEELAHDPANLTPAHRGCNSARRWWRVAGVQSPPVPLVPPDDGTPSRDW